MGVSEGAGLLASGSFSPRSLPVPRCGTVGVDRDHAWIVSGYSGGGRAGITPASLERTHSRPLMRLQSELRKNCGAHLSKTLLC